MRIGEYGLEELFNDQNVDIEIWGHVHNYGRTFPLFNYTYEEQPLDIYTDPKFPVHVITGYLKIRNYSFFEHLLVNQSWKLLLLKIFLRKQFDVLFDSESKSGVSDSRAPPSGKLLLILILKSAKQLHFKTTMNHSTQKF